MKKIVITRAEDQGQDFAFLLCHQIDGLCPVHMLFEPMIHINPVAFDSPDFTLFDAIIITSANAIENLSVYETPLLPMYCVGNNTADKAKSVGFTVAYTAPNVQQLLAYIHSQHKDVSIRFLYVRGRDVACDIAGILKPKGHHVEELISYAAIAVQSLSQDFIHAVTDNKVGAITFFSKRTAEVFLSLVFDTHILAALKPIKALCISNSVLECVYPVFGGNAVASDFPDASGMARLVKGYLENSTC